MLLPGTFVYLRCHYRMTSNPNNSETTPLTASTREAQDSYQSASDCVHWFCIYPTANCVLDIWGPYLNSGVATERQKWERELRERRLQEQLREKEWEMEQALLEQLRKKEWERQMQREGT
jgi:hypothetical protein